MADEFLKKVYDRYLGSDYEWGDADLNPKREISRTDAEQLQEDQEAILQRIAARLHELNAQAAALPKYRAPEVIDNDNFLTESAGVGGNGDPNPDYNDAELQMRLALGGNADSNKLVMPDGDYDSQIDFLLSQIDGVIIPLLIPYTGSINAPGNQTSPTIQMYNPGCDEFGDEDIDMNDASPDSRDRKNDMDDEAGDDDSDSEEDDSLTTGGGSSKTTSEAADAAALSNEQAASREVIERNKEIAGCIAKELGILQAILILLTIISVIKQGVIFLLSIIIPIVQIITLASQCWINPPAASDVIQKTAEKIAALLISAIGEIIQLIWNMLEFDCRTQQLQSFLDRINDVLSGLNFSLLSTKSLISFTKNQTTAIAQSLQASYNRFKQTSQWKEAWADLKNATTWENLKNTQKNAIDDMLFDGKGLSKEGMSAAMSNVLSSDIKRSLNSLLSSAKGVTAEANDLYKNTGIKDTSLSQKLTDMADFLGPLKIR